MADSLRNALNDVVTFLPKLLLAAIIVVVGYFIAKALEKLLVTVLDKVGFDRAVERGGIKKALQNSSYDAAQILAKIVFYAVMLFVLSTAFGVFGPNPISDYLAAIIGYLPKVFVAILILVIAAAIAAAVRLLVQNSLGALSYGRLVAGAAGTLVLALGVIAALDQLQIAQNVVNAVLYAVLVAVVGVVVVAVGGGGIVPMRQRWENALSTVEAEAPNVRRAARSARPASEVLKEESDRLAAARQDAERAEAEQRADADRQAAQRAEAEQAARQPAVPPAPPVLPYGQPAEEPYHPTEVYDQQSFAQPAYQLRPESPGYAQEPHGQHGAAQDEGPGFLDEQYAAQQYDEPTHDEPAYDEPTHDGTTYDQPLDATPQYGHPEHDEPQHDEPRYGDPQYGEQYGTPQPWSTGATAVPDPQQAYPQPPVPTVERQPEHDDGPGTAQLPRIAEDTPAPGEDERPR